MALSSKGCFKIGNVEFKPSKLNTIYDSLASEDSGRDDSGVMRIDWIKQSIVKLEIEMPPLTPTEAHNILSVVQGQIYNITYFDIKTEAESTIQVYTSTSQGNCYSGVLNSNTGLWEGVAFNAIATGA